MLLPIIRHNESSNAEDARTPDRSQNVNKSTRRYTLWVPFYNQNIATSYISCFQLVIYIYYILRSLIISFKTKTENNVQQNPCHRVTTHKPWYINFNIIYSYIYVTKKSRMGCILIWRMRVYTNRILFAVQIVRKVWFYIAFYIHIPYIWMDMRIWWLFGRSIYAIFAVAYIYYYSISR